MTMQRTACLTDYPYVELRQARGEVVVERPDFSSFFRAEYVPLVRAFFLLTADRAEAEELAQAALARAYERWGEHDGVAGGLRVPDRGEPQPPPASPPGGSRPARRHAEARVRLGRGGGAPDRTGGGDRV